MKHFRAHLGNVQDIALNHNGTLLATVSNDKMAKIFDVVNFDMINIIKLGERKFQLGILPDFNLPEGEAGRWWNNSFKVTIKSDGMTDFEVCTILCMYYVE